MSKNCSVKISLGGVVYELDSLLLTDSDSMGEFISILFNSNPELVKEIMEYDNSPEEFKNLFSTVGNKELINSGLKGTYSFRSYVNKFWGTDNSIKAILNSLDRIGYNSDDRNIIVDLNGDYKSKVLKGDNRNFYIFTGSSRNSNQIKSILISNYFNNSNKETLDKFKSIYTKVKKQLVELDSIISNALDDINKSKEPLKEFINYSLSDIQFQKALKSKNLWDEFTLLINNELDLSPAKKIEIKKTTEKVSTGKIKNYNITVKSSGSLIKLGEDIQVNSEKLKYTYDNKLWKNPSVLKDGTTAKSLNIEFNNLNDLLEFLIYKEEAKNYYKKESMKDSDYEDLINNQAYKKYIKINYYSNNNLESYLKHDKFSLTSRPEVNMISITKNGETVSLANITSITKLMETAYPDMANNSILLKDMIDKIFNKDAKEEDVESFFRDLQCLNGAIPF